MRNLPIVPHHVPQPSPVMLAKVERLAEQLRIEHPEFAVADMFADLVATTLPPGSAIHVDDFSGITRLEPGHDISFYQHRARLRAADGDVVLAAGSSAGEYEAYCRDKLRLGNVTWLHPEVRNSPVQVAEAAWEDRGVRRELVSRIRSGVIRYVHPHMGTLPVWELALLLKNCSHLPIKVIAPLPELTRWTNDKVEFTETVARLFGDEAVPESASAWNESQLIPKLIEIANHCDFVGIKLPDSAGGDGNFVFDTAEIRDRTLKQVLRLVHERIPAEWNRDSPMLIDAWETDVLCSPSVQTWIPPVGDGLPVIEGVFVQATEGVTGMFVGNQPARFPHTLTEEIVEKSYLVALLFQELGYVGRCSLDLILVGPNEGNCHVEFIECNGRWGGTSLPMTLMNRLHEDWNLQPYAAKVITVPGLDRLSFSELRAALNHRIYDADTGTGDLVLYNPKRMTAGSGIDVIAFGQTWDQASAAIAEVPKLVEEIVSEARVGAVM